MSWTQYDTDVTANTYISSQYFTSNIPSPPPVSNLRLEVSLCHLCLPFLTSLPFLFRSLLPLFSSPQYYTRVYGNATTLRNTQKTSDCRGWSVRENIALDRILKGDVP